MLSGAAVQCTELWANSGCTELGNLNALHRATGYLGLLCRVHSTPSINRPWDTFYGSDGMLLNRDRICSLKTAFILTTTDTDDWEMIVTVSSTNIWPNLVKLLWIHQKIDHQQQIPTQPIRFRLKASGISYMISIPPSAKNSILQQYSHVQLREY